MNRPTLLRRASRACAALCTLLVVLFLGCRDGNDRRIQGYVEGEFVYISSPLGGYLESLAVVRGAQVEAGAQLFSLESTVEKSALVEAQNRLAEAQSVLADLRKGSRPSELAALEAQRKQAQAEHALAVKEHERQERLLKANATARESFDRAVAVLAGAAQRVAQLEASLVTARLGGRSDQIDAAAAQVDARQAAVRKAEWELAQKTRTAPAAGLVFDTYYRIGEWVAPGSPVASLLPPEAVKVRGFVPEPMIAQVRLDQPAQILIDGRAEPVNGTVTFISPEAEFTPPVIYSRESRSKLVFMIELSVEPSAAATLHPGQPVDLNL